MVVSERAVKDAAIAKVTHPTDREVAVAETDALRRAIGFVRHVERNENAAVLAQAALANAINLVADLKIFAVKCGSERMRGIDNFDGPCAVGLPRMPLEMSAHHVCCFRPT